MFLKSLIFAVVSIKTMDHSPIVDISLLSRTPHAAAEFDDSHSTLG